MESGRNFQSLLGLFKWYLAVPTPLLDVLANTAAWGFPWGVSLGHAGDSWRQHLDVPGPAGILEACPSWSLRGPGTEISVPLPLP